MPDQLYCLSDPSEPGLVRLTAWRHSSRMQGVPICKPGERIDWMVEVGDAKLALDALHRTMRRYRKNRGGGIYRCSPIDAHEIAIRYIARPRKSWHSRFWHLVDRKIAPTPNRRAVPVSSG